ncbi:MAG: NAD-dependent epimerase/dehydratase family protein [Actinomycetota bacterium]
MPSYEKILVTGGAGLIGSHIVDQLVAQQADGTYGEVVIIDDFTRGRMANLATAVDTGNVTVVEGDITDPAQVTSVMDGVDLVFHLAAIRITHCAEDPRLAVDVLGNGTFNVIEAAQRADVAKIVASSTASIYGLAETFPTTEDHHPYNNRTLYGAIKVFNEGLLRSFHDMFDLDYVALRYFNVYGDRMDAFGKYTEVLIRWMERLEAGQPPLIFGDGEQTMDFVHARDIARANLCAAQAPVTDRAYNIASNTETSLKDLAAALGQAMEIEIAPEHGPERAVNPVPRRLADISAAAADLGWTPEIDLDTGLRGLVEWWRAETAAASS